jgi:hypothetical protein
MNALMRRFILNSMPPPIIKNPGLALGHVHDFTAAMKLHLRPGHDRNVHPHTRMPVMIDISMVGHTRPRSQSHQPRPTPNDTEAAEYLPHIRHPSQPPRRQHLPMQRLGLDATRTDELHGAIAREPIRMRPPSLRRQRRYLGLEPIRIDNHGKLKKRTR